MLILIMKQRRMLLHANINPGVNRFEPHQHSNQVHTMEADLILFDHAE